MSRIIDPNERKIITVEIKRLQTFDGLGSLQSPAQIGQAVKLDMNTVRPVEVTNADGTKHNKIIVDTVNENGELGNWVYAELFFDKYVIQK